MSSLLDASLQNISLFNSMICPIHTGENWSTQSTKARCREDTLLLRWKDIIAFISRSETEALVVHVRSGLRRKTAGRVVRATSSVRRRRNQTLALPAVLHINVIHISHVDRLERSASWPRLPLAHKLCTSSFHSTRGVIFSVAQHGESRAHYTNACSETLPGWFTQYLHRGSGDFCTTRLWIFFCFCFMVNAEKHNMTPQFWFDVM